MFVIFGFFFWWVFFLSSVGTCIGTLIIGYSRCSVPTLLVVGSALESCHAELMRVRMHETWRRDGGVLAFLKEGSLKF